MRNTLIIAGGVVAGFAILAGLWWYLLVNGGPEELALENPFSTGGEVAVSVVEPLEEELSTDTRSPLRRIHPRPVAGAAMISDGSRSLVHFAELGTGHLYAYDPSSGTSTRLSGTTVPRTIDAAWSPDGVHVVLTTQGDAGTVRNFLATLVSTVAESSTTSASTAPQGDVLLETIELDRDAENIAFSPDGASLYFTLPTASGSTGYAYDPETGAREVRFTSPLRDLRVAWEPAPVAYASPSADADGYAFYPESGERIVGGLSGLILTPAGERVVLTYIGEDGPVSRASTIDGTQLTLTVFPEKCTPDPFAPHILWCAAPTALPAGRYPDSWYQGVVTLEDELWQLNTVTGSATLLSIPTEDAGVSIDAVGLTISNEGDVLTFINKRDGGLWLQEIQ